MNHGLLQFGEFELDCARYELRRREPKRPASEGAPYNDPTLRTVKLEKIPMDLLILLAESDGRLVTREEIEERLWGKDVFVDAEHGINTAIRKVRQALGDDSDEPRFVQTVQKKGYRFVAEVKVVVEDGARKGMTQASATAEAKDFGPAEAEVSETAGADAVSRVATEKAKSSKRKWIWIAAATGIVLAGSAAKFGWPRLTRAEKVVPGTSSTSVHPSTPTRARAEDVQKTIDSQHPSPGGDVLGSPPEDSWTAPAARG